MSVSADPEIVHDPVFRHRLRFTDTTDEHGDPAVLCEMWVDPGGGVPPHVHPRMEERFTVKEGRMEFLAGLAIWWDEHPHVARERIVETAMNVLWTGFERLQADAAETGG